MGRHLPSVGPQLLGGEHKQTQSLGQTRVTRVLPLPSTASLPCLVSFHRQSLFAVHGVRHAAAWPANSNPEGSSAPAIHRDVLARWPSQSKSDGCPALPRIRWFLLSFLLAGDLSNLVLPDPGACLFRLWRFPRCVPILQRRILSSSAQSQDSPHNRPLFPLPSSTAFLCLWEMNSSG